MHHRTSLTIALTAAALTSPLAAQLGPMPAPQQNPTTPEKVLLGKFLFWEEQLSSDDSMACGTCHLPEFGGSDGRQPLAIEPGFDGVHGTPDDVIGSAGVVRQNNALDFRRSARFGLDRQVTPRWSPTNLGAGHHTALFWDNRATGTFTDPETGNLLIPVGGALESQSIAPIRNGREMSKDGRTWQDVRQKLQAVEPLKLARSLTPDLASGLQQYGNYPAMFQAAFGTPAIDAGRIAFALAAYQRTLNPDQTPWDQYVAGNTNALTPAQVQGWQLFQNQALCSACHLPPFFSDDLPHNLGLRFNVEDPGVSAVSGIPAELGAFKTPTLRNAGIRTRMFHNGQSPALDDPAQLTDPASVLNIYLNGGGVDPSNLDPFMQPLVQLGITTADLLLVLDFVGNALTDPRAANAQPPFDHPTLRSFAVPPPQRFNQGTTGAVEPFLIDTVPPFPGNLDYRLGVAGGDGAGIALLTYGVQSFQPGLSFGGLPWHVNVLGWIPVALQGPPGFPGHATLPLPIPNNPALNQLVLYLQLFVDDPLATQSLGIASSQGYELVIQ